MFENDLRPLHQDLRNDPRWEGAIPLRLIDDDRAFEEAPVIGAEADVAPFGKRRDGIAPHPCGREDRQDLRD
jgi:hypothetical protein